MVGGRERASGDRDRLQPRQRRRCDGMCSSRCVTRWRGSRIAASAPRFPVTNGGRARTRLRGPRSPTTSPTAAMRRDVLFPVRDAVAWKQDRRIGTEIPGDKWWAGENAPPGTAIAYNLANGGDAPIKVTHPRSEKTT